MKSREEILRRIKNAHSWRETGVTLSEAYAAFSDDSRAVTERTYKLPHSTGEQAKNAVKMASEAESDLVRELKEKIDRLTDANKKLRDENKALKGGGKK